MERAAHADFQSVPAAATALALERTWLIVAKMKAVNIKAAFSGVAFARVQFAPTSCRLSSSKHGNINRGMQTQGLGKYVPYWRWCEQTIGETGKRVELLLAPTPELTAMACTSRVRSLRLSQLTSIRVAVEPGTVRAAL